MTITLRQECLAEMKRETKTSYPKHQAPQPATVTPVVLQQTLVQELPKPTVAETKEMDPLYLKLLQEMKAMRATLEETKEKNSPCPSLEPLATPTGVQPPQEQSMWDLPGTVGRGNGPTPHELGTIPTETAGGVTPGAMGVLMGGGGRGHCASTSSCTQHNGL